MPELNADVPRFECLVRAEFLYGFQDGFGDFEPGICHSVAAIQGRALGFHVLLDNGAHIGRLPIHALVQHERATVIPESDVWRLQLWDCFSYKLSVIEHDWLSELRVKCALTDGTVLGGEYMFTVDYYGSDVAEDAGHAGWKCHHVLALDNGCYAALPNNRVAFAEPSRVTPFDQPPKYKIMPRTWKTEHGAKWRVSDDDRYFYDVKARK